MTIDTSERPDSEGGRRYPTSATTHLARVAASTETFVKLQAIGSLDKLACGSIIPTARVSQDGWSWRRLVIALTPGSRRLVWTGSRRSGPLAPAAAGIEPNRK